MTTFVRESTIVFRRQIRMNLRNPAWVLIGIMQPVLYLVLFGPLLKPLVGSFGVGTDNAYTVLVPGLLVQLGINSIDELPPVSPLLPDGADGFDDVP